ncbi:MAG TPA: GNAT family N-acetyltransferase [Microcella sp.]|nr:GNAT family N-acetyltransferase [Microcella sp.]
MTIWRESSPDDPAARILLEQYFAMRAEQFERASRDYHRTWPDAAQFAPPRGVFLIVEDENLAGEPADVGCGGIRMIDAGPVGPRAELKHLWVQPHARRRGHGAALIAELTARARERGAAELVLDTHSSLEAAGALYTALGFTPIAPYNDNPNANTWLGLELATTG